MNKAIKRQLGLLLNITLVSHAYAMHEPYFHSLYPFISFKSIVDTCMKSYTDVLLIQDRLYCHEKIDEQVDLLVGRLMRLKSYIDQAIYAYKHEATITYDELEYLLRMLDYLEVTIAEQSYKQIYDSLNVIISDFKKEIRQALQIQLAWFYPSVSWSPVRFAFCVPLPPYGCLERTIKHNTA